MFSTARIPVWGFWFCDTDGAFVWCYLCRWISQESFPGSVRVVGKMQFSERLEEQLGSAQRFDQAPFPERKVRGKAVDLEHFLKHVDFSPGSCYLTLKPENGCSLFFLSPEVPVGDDCN